MSCPESKKSRIERRIKMELELQLLDLVTFFSNWSESELPCGQTTGGEEANGGERRLRFLRSPYSYSQITPFLGLPKKPKKVSSCIMVVIVVTLVLSVLLAALFFIPRARSSGQSEKVRSNVDAKPSRSYSKAEVALHNKRTDCWIIIKDRVYDVTPYVEEHPGGDAILEHAGDDSTEGFFGPQHATRVFDMIEDFYVGNLEL